MIKINKFNIDKLIKNINEGSHAPIIYVSGIRQSGKTFFINNLLSKVNVKIINFSNEDENYNPRHGSSLDIPKLEKIITEQKNKMRARNRETLYKTEKIESNYERILLNFDHVVFDHENINELFMAGRHLLTSAIFSFQYVPKMSQKYCCNCDYVFIFNPGSNKSNINRIYEDFFRIFCNIEYFEKALKECTENDGCLVIDQTIRTNKIEDCVFWYRVEEVGDCVSWYIVEKVENIV